MANQKLTQAEQIAETFGVVLGAASRCEKVTEDEIDTVAAKVQQIVSAAATDQADEEAAAERFSVAVEAGRAAAEDGSIDLDDAASALRELEQQLRT